MTWALSLWAGLAVLGFAMVFSVPRKTLPGIVALAIAAHLVRSLFLDQGAALPVASFAAAVLVGLTAAIVAPRTNQATPIYAFAPVIPLIPGTYMFDALTGVLDLTSGAARPLGDRRRRRGERIDRDPDGDRPGRGHDQPHAAGRSAPGATGRPARFEGD